MITRYAGFVVILSCALAGCNREGANTSKRHQEQPATAPAAEHQPANQPTYVPQEKTDSIRIEGTTQPLKLKLVQPSGSLPFLTYMPEDMVFEQSSADEGEAYYFYTNFAGRKNEEAYVLMFVFPPNTQQADAVKLVKAWVASRANVKPAEYERFSFKRNGVLYNASIDLRMHGDRYYYLAKQYPAEYADGFGPRAARIADEWEWLR